MGPRPNGHSGPYQIMPFRLPTLGVNAKRAFLYSQRSSSAASSASLSFARSLRKLMPKRMDIMRCTQRRQHVATDVNESRNAGAPQGGPLLSRAPRQIDMTCAGVFQGCRSIGALAAVQLIRRAQARELGAGGLECLDHRVAGGEAVVAYCLDAAGGEQILGEGCARGEVGGRAEIGEEDFRPRAGAREHPIGSVAKLFERF